MMEHYSLPLTIILIFQAREALEQTIRVIESRPDWGGKVVYGDTDSVFVLLKGKSKVKIFYQDIQQSVSFKKTKKNYSVSSNTVP